MRYTIEYHLHSANFELWNSTMTPNIAINHMFRIQTGKIIEITRKPILLFAMNDMVMDAALCAVRSD